MCALAVRTESFVQTGRLGCRGMCIFSNCVFEHAFITERNNFERRKRRNWLCTALLREHREKNRSSRSHVCTRSLFGGQRLVFQRCLVFQEIFSSSRNGARVSIVDMNILRRSLSESQHHDELIKKREKVRCEQLALLRHDIQAILTLNTLPRWMIRCLSCLACNLSSADLICLVYIKQAGSIIGGFGSNKQAVFMLKCIRSGSE